MLSTTASNNLNKAHVKYLESRLVEEARRIGKVAMDNGNTPPRPSLSEAARANMENFLEYILMVLPALRADSFLAHTHTGAWVSSWLDWWGGESSDLAARDEQLSDDSTAINQRRDTAR